MQGSSQCLGSTQGHQGNQNILEEIKAKCKETAWNQSKSEEIAWICFGKQGPKFLKVSQRHRNQNFNQNFDEFPSSEIGEGARWLLPCCAEPDAQAEPWRCPLIPDPLLI